MQFSRPAKETCPSRTEWRRPSSGAEADHLAFFAGLAQFLDDAYPMKMKLRKDGHWERTPKSSAMEPPVRAVV